ncbi:hypothetical protein [Streptomyces sp. NPDC002619]|uniref:hypothetical protein n=1 Tax=Streptomyces sp. NPDC002619 TaxID=3364655 RepID=UPI0036CD5803
MTGGQRYWNEDAQRWEDGAEPRPAATPMSPPPARPDFAPRVVDGPVTAVDGPGTDGDVAWHAPVAVGSTVADGSVAGVWPPSEPVVAGPGGRSSSGLDRRRVWSVVVGAAVVGVAVSLVLTLVVGKGDGTPDDRTAAESASASPSRSEQPTPSPTDTAPPSPSATEPPVGYEAYDDEEGFRIALPEGWKRSAFESSYGVAVVNYRSPDKEHRLQVYPVSEESPDASFELYLSDRTGKPRGFQKLALQNLDDAEFTGSRLEYLADSLKGEPDVGTWHVYDERFVAADGRIYALAAYGPESDGRDDELEVLTTALDWFCPPYTTCDADPSLD